MQSTPGPTPIHAPARQPPSFGAERSQAVVTAPVSAGHRWAARGAILAAIAGVVIPAIFVGLRSLPLLLIGVAGVAMSLAGAWLGLTHRGVRRWAGTVVAVLAMLGVIVIYAFAEFLHIVVLAVALLLIAGITARVALRSIGPAVPEYDVPAPGTHS